MPYSCIVRRLICVKALYTAWMKTLLSHITRFFNSKNRLAVSHTEAIKGIQLFNQLAVEDYLRDSSVPALAQQINPLIKSYLRHKITWKQQLHTETIKQLEQMVLYVPIEKNINKLREHYEKAVLIRRQCFYDNVESNPLTKEQRLAVIRNNDRNLVLAAAGTGKTSVIVANVLDLMDSDKAQPSDILVLAYNTAAAKELRERLTQRARLMGIESEVTPCIMTFHALGRKVLQQANISTSLSMFVHDSLKREAWLSGWLTERFKTDAKGRRTLQGKKGFVLEDVKLYLKCLQAIRTEQLNVEGILKRLRAAKIPQAKQQAAFLWEVVNAYQAELLRQEAIDFDDMILRSIDALQNKLFIPVWKHILIDEFQDISGARMELIHALIHFGPQPCLTAVGDDWQAIYRFAGGKLELTTQFDRLVGSNTKTMLQKTFRYNNSIAEVAGRFVMQNPEQFKKHIQTHHQVIEPQIYLLDSRTAKNANKMEDRTLQVVRTIRKHDPSGSIAILARYRYLLTNVKDCISAAYTCMDNLHYWTFHGAKGLEADYCVLLGFFKGKVGFPNQSKNEALLEALLPSLDTYPYSEERRLFYVALTRAKKKSYLIADSVERSLFVDELLAEKYNIHLSGGFLRKSAH